MPHCVRIVVFQAAVKHGARGGGGGGSEVCFMFLVAVKHGGCSGRWGVA